MYLIKNKNVELLQDRYYLSKNEYLFKMKYVRIKNLKDLCGIFNNLINEFRKIRKERNEALELFKKVEYVIYFNLACINKNKEFLKSEDLLYDLFSFYNLNSKASIIRKETNDLIYVLKNANSICFNAYDSMNKKFKQQNFEGVKQEYTKLINNLNDYEKRHNIKLF